MAATLALSHELLRYLQGTNTSSRANPGNQQWNFYDMLRPTYGSTATAIDKHVRKNTFITV